MKKGKKLFSFLLTVCLTILMAVPVLADDTEMEIVNKMRSGVLQVNLNWIDQNGGRHFIQGGSGFLINDQTLLTNQHVVTMSDETKQSASEAYGVDFVNDTKLDVRVQVVVQRDVVIDATVMQSSAEMDVAILELSSPIYDRISLELGDSSTVKEGKAVYALGFPLLSELAQDVQYYTSSDVSITTDIVSKRMERNSTPFFQHGAKISDGNSGGPLVTVDADGVGRVVGINTSRVSIEEGYYYAMEINDVKSLLDQLGVTYNSNGAAGSGSDETAENTGENQETTEEKEEKQEEPEATVADTSALEKAIAKAEDKEAEGDYTEESVKELEDKLDSAYEVLDDSEASQELIDKAEADVEEAADNLEEKAGMGMLLWIIIGAAVVIIVIIVVVLVVVSGNKKKKAAQERMMRQRAEEQRRTAPARPQQPYSQQPQPQSYNPAPAHMEGAGETSVLGEGRGETTVLGASAQGSAYMIRKKNNERVVISGPSFTIGKERSRVNYCISDNTSVSRCHARIMRKGSQYFVTDMNSTNFTFVNGVKVMPGQEVPLNDNDVVRFADEDFVFHM